MLRLLHGEHLTNSIIRLITFNPTHRSMHLDINKYFEIILNYHVEHDRTQVAADSCRWSNSRTGFHLDLQELPIDRGAGGLHGSHGNSSDLRRQPTWTNLTIIFYTQ